MSKETVSVEVSEGLIKPIIEAKIQAAIVREFKADPAIFIDAIVARALDTKVDEQGNVNSSSYQNRHRFLTVMVERTIREEAKTALAELIDKQRSKIRASITRQLLAGRGAERIAAACVKGIEKSMDCKYSSTLSVKFDSPKD